uniref:Uncharacterized protein n=1 Tax=Micrurus corallinus TaxID=54390 RepID=A0A2D4F8I0_MICCO
MGEKMAKTEPSFREMEHYLFLNDTHYFLRTTSIYWLNFINWGKLQQRQTMRDLSKYMRNPAVEEKSVHSGYRSILLSGTLLPSATFLWNRLQKTSFLQAATDL